MPTIHRLGVFLNGSPADATVFAQTRGLAHVCPPDHCHFFHYRQRSHADKQPDPTPEEFAAAVLEACPELGDKMSSEVIPEAGAKAILRSVRQHDLDLIVVGRRLPSDQLIIGSTYSRLARKAPCHVMVVTEYSYPHFERFLIPVDFSEHSKLAIALAVFVIRQLKCDRPQITLQHNVEVGYGHRYAGVTFEEYARTLEEHAQGDILRFTAGLDLSGIEVSSIVTCSARPEEAVVGLATARKVDVVCLGSHGADSVFGALLGDTAERILAACPLPVLIAKRREEATQLLDLILKGEVT